MSRTITIMLACCIAVGCSTAAVRDAPRQDASCRAVAPPESEVVADADEPPRLVGGLDALQRRVAYPELARRAGIEGVVQVQLLVSPEGCVADPVCVEDPGGGTCEESLRTVRSSEYAPGRKNGRAVWARFEIPVTFELPE